MVNSGVAIPNDPSWIYISSHFVLGLGLCLSTVPIGSNLNNSCSFPTQTQLEYLRGREYSFYSLEYDDDDRGFSSLTIKGKELRI